MEVVLGLMLLVAFLTVPWMVGRGLSRVARSRRLPWLLLLALLVATVATYAGLALFRWDHCEPRNVCDGRDKEEGVVIAAAWFAAAFAIAGAFWGRPRRERRPDDDLEPWNPTGHPIAPGDLLPRPDDGSNGA